MKKVLYGLLWFMIFWVGSASVMGLTLNRIAAFQGKTPEQEKKMVEEVGQLLGNGIFLFSIAGSMIGTRTGSLPGTKENDDC